jgi:hypothetical protein
MGWLSDKLFGKRKSLDLDKLKDYMAPTQGLVNEQLGMSRDMMDPNSLMNLGMRNFMTSRAATQGAQTGSQVQKLGAMFGASPAQTMMQARMGMSDAMGGVEDNYLQWMQGQQQQGLGLMGNMTGMMQGLNENEANAYVQSINAHNAKRAGRVGFATNMLGMAVKAATMGGGGTPPSQ